MKNAMRALMMIAALLALVSCGAAPSAVCTTDAGAAPTYASFGADFLARYCVGCHSAMRAEKGVELSTEVLAARHSSEVLRAAGTGTSMPPSDSLLPSDAERAQLTQWLVCGE